LYDFNWGIRTYVLVGATFGWLASTLPIFIVGKLLIITTVLSLAGSVFWLSKILNGRVTPWALGSCLFGYNFSFSSGFFPYCLAIRRV